MKLSHYGKALDCFPSKMFYNELELSFWHPTPVLLPGKSHGRRSLVGCRPWCLEESDTTERLHFHFTLSCSGEGNGNPLQCSCLENPRDGGAWWAAVYGVAQSWTWLKRLSSSSRALIQRGHLQHLEGKSCGCRDSLYAQQCWITIIYTCPWVFFNARWSLFWRCAHISQTIKQILWIPRTKITCMQMTTYLNDLK